ncbi:SufE family protein [Teredinibacter turnerae]|uniref:SufE family protein n=1 Tax=Teredinibacter turnerae TaxID=2426 RepID=UPI0003777778|nr:SufE family protein [Teredinibacter turnerae]
MSSAEENPFGNAISSDDIIDTLSFFDGWEDRYKYIIDLGKELPAMDESKRSEVNLVKGCQSQVWIEHFQVDNRFWFEVDSDAFIVKGLLGVILAAYNGKTADDIAAFDIEQYFDQLGLMRHLSPTRGNGLRAMVEKIRALAA